MVWKDGDTNDFDEKWTKTDINQINNRLKQIKLQKPREIHRAVRGLDDLKFWKGTEFRSFLLYFGMVALKDNLSERIYNHFITLVCAVTVFTSDVYMAYIVKADEWLHRYIERNIDIYGIHSITSNVHNLAHIFKDVSRYGNLNSLSTYPYENRLNFLKSRIKQKHLPLEQITRRIVELSLDYDKLYSYDMSKNEIYPELRFPFQYSNEQMVYKEISFSSDYTISSKSNANKWFLTFSGKIVQMVYAFSTGVNEFYIYGQA